MNSPLGPTLIVNRILSYSKCGCVGRLSYKLFLLLLSKYDRSLKKKVIVGTNRRASFSIFATFCSRALGPTTINTADCILEREVLGLVCSVYTCMYLYNTRFVRQKLKLVLFTEVRDRMPMGTRFSAPVQTGPGGNRASSTIGMRLFPGG
jgi:hypothetical protein